MKLGPGLGEARWAGGMVYVGVLLSGCGAVTASPQEGPCEGDSIPAAGAAPLAVSGKRLTAVAHAAGDAVNFSHFFDEQLKVDCSFQRDADGVARCFPEPRSSVVYLDEQCEQQPAVFQDLVSAGQLFVEESAEVAPSSDELRSAHRWFEVTALVSDAEALGETPTVYGRYNGRCQVTYPRGKGAPAIYRALPRDPHELVAARLVTSPVSQRAQVRRIVAEDGAELSLGAASADGTPCHLEADGVCVPEGVDVATSLQLPQAKPVLLGTGPLRVAALELAGSGGTYLLTAPGSTGRFVSADGSTCGVVTWADGTLRCLDGDDELVQTGYFADAACTVRAYRRLDSMKRPLTDASVRRSIVTEWTTGGISDVRSVRPHDGAPYVMREQQCSLLTAELATAMVEIYGEPPQALLIVDENAPPVELPRIEVVRL